MRAWIAGQIRIGQREQSVRRPQSVFLEVNERAGNLDQTFVEISVRVPPRRQPQLFQDVVRLEILPAIEAVKITGVMRINALLCGGCRQRCDLNAFLFHANNGMGTERGRCGRPWIRYSVKRAAAAGRSTGSNSKYAKLLPWP